MGIPVPFFFWQVCHRQRLAMNFKCPSQAGKRLPLTNNNPTHLDIDTDDGRSRKSGSKMDDKEKAFQQALAAISGCIVLTKNKHGDVHATYTHTDAFETVPLNSPKVLNKIKRIVIDALKLRLSKVVLEELVEELKNEADTPTIERREVHHRVARGMDGQIYIDLCNQAGGVLEVDAEGYRLLDVVKEIPLFLRSSGMTKLPDPMGVRPDLGLLRNFVNVPSDDAWWLLVVYILYCYRPGGPYVILVIGGTAGSSKSTFSRVIRQLVDPSSVSTQAVPKSPVDLMITARNSHMLVFDNVRQLTLDMSDALCRLATGGGMRTRALYTNSDEALFHASRPCMLNGIGDLANQTDLLSRCVHLELPVIQVRRTEEEFDRSLEKAISPIFAGLMEALSRTLAVLPEITELPSSRMADFERFGMAVERALNWPVGSFKRAYARNQKEQMKDALGDDLLAQALRELVRDEVPGGTDHTRTPTALLNELDGLVTDAERMSKAAWPQSAHSLSKRLKKIEPALRACGIGVEFHHSGNRTITLTRLEIFK